MNTGDGPDQRSDLYWILDQIHLEGTADMINIPTMPDDDARRLFMAHVQEAPSFLERLDSGLVEAARDPGRADALGQRLRRDIVWSGHPVGFHMASVIAAAMGTRAVALAAADPVLFMKSFRQASLESGQEPPLTEDAVAAAEKMFYRR